MKVRTVLAPFCDDRLFPVPDVDLCWIRTPSQALLQQLFRQILVWNSLTLERARALISFQKKKLGCSYLNAALQNQTLRHVRTTCSEDRIAQWHWNVLMWKMLVAVGRIVSKRVVQWLKKHCGAWCDAGCRSDKQTPTKLREGIALRPHQVLAWICGTTSRHSK